MSTITPLRVLLLFVLRLIPYLSFSNPPLPLWLHKGIFLLLCWCGVMALGGLSELSHAQPLTLAINTAEGGVAKPRYVKALEAWLADRSCRVAVTTQVQQASGDLVFDLREKQSNNASPLLFVADLSNDDLESLWLIKRVSVGGGVDSLKGERVALLSDSSLVGYQRPLKQLAALGVNIENLTILQSDQYQGVMTLLLHGDVFAAAVPRIFANTWMAPNDLAVLVTEPQLFGRASLQAGIWLDEKNSFGSQALTDCIQALSELKREGRRDLKMRLFPEWVRGFSAIPD